MNSNGSTINLVVPGLTPSKKNSKQIVPVRGRYIIISSERHKSWHSVALKSLQTQNLPPVSLSNTEAVHLTIWGDSKRKWDISNRAESIMDLLVDAKILTDDNYEVVPCLVIKYGGIDKENPRCEITIHLQEVSEEM